MDKTEFLKAWHASGNEELAAQLAPATANAENRTIDVIWFSGADVARYSYMLDEEYTLRFDKNGADLSLLNSGAPVIDNHWLFDTNDQKGKVEKAWEDGGKYYGTLRFSKRESVTELWSDITDGIVSKFSMGVEILKHDDIRKADEKMVRLATKWRPFEISLAPIPADFGTCCLSRTATSNTDESLAHIQGVNLSRLRQVEALRLR